MFDDRRSESEVPDASELISAFVDGEDVDAAALEEVLAAPEGFELLLDFLRLRARLAREWNAQPSSDLSEAMGERLAMPRRPWTSLRVRLVAATAASLGVGILLGLLMGGSRAPTTDPPPPSRTLRFESGVDWYAHASEDPRSEAEPNR